MAQGKVKILNYLNRFYNVDDVGDYGVLWPVAVFSASIPTKKEKPLNIFEESILKILKLNIRNVNVISEELCLDKEIIKFIIDKLFSYNLIDQNHELSKEGNDLIEQWETEEIEYASASIFYDLIGQEILPTVIYDELQFERIANREGKSIKFYDSRFDRNNSKSFGHLLKHNSYDIKTPSTKEINKIMNIHQKIHFEYISSSSKDARYIPDYFTEGGAIRVNDNYNIHYLYCKVIFQRGSSDFIITDPFGYGFSSIFKKGYSAYLTIHEFESDKFIVKQKNAIAKKMDKPIPNKNVINLSMFTDKIKVYPKVRRAIVKIEKSWKYGKIKPNNSIEKANQQKNFDTILINCYTALEWSLMAVLNKYPIKPSLINALQNNSYKQNSNLACKFAEKKGYEIPDNFKLLEIAGGKYKAVISGPAELQSLISLSLLSTNNNHPFILLAEKFPEWLKRMVKLKSLRDAVKHGEHDKSNNTLEEVKLYRTLTYETIRILLPETNIIDRKKDNAKIDDSDFDDEQEREKANIQLQTDFGYNGIKIFNHNIQESLIRINIFMLENSSSIIDEIDCSFPITEIASIYQNITNNIVRKQLSNSSKVEIEKNDNFQEKFYKIIEKHFNISKIETPQSLCYVNRNRVQQALSGTNITLGANLIALINLANLDILNSLSRIKPNLINMIGKALQLRGHSNEPAPMDLNEFKSFKNKVYETYKQLQEIENE